MAPKKKKGETKVTPTTHTKYVAAAGMWCTTIVDEKGQRQTWTTTKP